MPIIAFLDETGNHSLNHGDADYPIFGLALLICEHESYARRIVPSFCKLKLDYFGREDVILHSTDIRKCRGEFAFLLNPEMRQPFYGRINEIMSGSDYQIIAPIIQKARHRQRYGENAINPYDLALEFALERLLVLMEQQTQETILIYAESRGKNEDEQLKEVFNRVTTYGTYYLKQERFAAKTIQLEFRRKEINITGVQMADLVAYPIARYVLNPDQANPAYEVVKKNLFVGQGNFRGLKIFP